MKRFVFFLIILVCLIIDDKVIVAYFKDVETTTKQAENPMKNTLEKYLKTKVKLMFKSSNAYINRCSVYRTNDNQTYFIKQNSKPEAKKMFLGEYESLKTILKTKTVLVPKPVTTRKADNDEFYIMMSYFNITKLEDDASTELGNNLADLHLFNLHQNCNKHTHVKKFGFHIETNCGHIPQNNTWTDDWITFFTENRLGYQIQLLESKPENSTEKHLVLTNHWPLLKPKIYQFFEGIEVRPSLLHGDLWFGNVAQTDSKKPVIFDPASFYGHHEYDMATTYMFNNLFGGNFSINFYNAYFKKIPKSRGFEDRKKLYHLFHYLNHWNQYSGGYIRHTMDLFEEVLKIIK